MKVVVIFDYPDIDPNSIEADEIIQNLELDLDEFSDETGYVWYIEDAESD